MVKLVEQHGSTFSILLLYIVYGKCNKIGNYVYFPAVMYNY